MFKLGLKKRKITLAIVFLTFFLDSLSATIVYPLFAPLFLGEHHHFLSSSLTFSSKAALLGLFLSLYPLSQIVFSPLLGVFSDRFGRKKSFLITTLLSSIGYALCAFSVERNVVYLLFMARVSMGIAGANMSLCLSSLADISSSAKEKTKWYTVGSMIAGVSFVLGPLVGGKLADSTLHPYFDLSFPLWIGGFFSLLNFFSVLFGFKETKECFEKAKKFSITLIFQEVTDAWFALKQGSLKNIFWLYFFYLLTWNMIFQFVPAFLVSNFASRVPIIGDICALLGISWILGNIFLYKAALVFFRRKTILCASGCALSFLVFLSFFSSKVQVFTFILCLGSFFASMCWPVCTSIISDRASPSHQGKIMGLTQSFQSLAMFIAPFMIAPFIAKDSLLPFSIAAASGLIFVLITSLTPIEEK